MKKTIGILAITLLLAAVVGVAFYSGWLPSITSSLSPRLQKASAKQIQEHIRKKGSRLTIVNFWATWCEPCKLEFPRLLELRREYNDKGVEVVFVSLDEVSEAGAVDAYLVSQGVDFVTFFKHDQPLSFVEELYPGWSGAIPASIILGPNAEFLDGWEGDTSKAEFESRIQGHLSL